MEASTTRSRPSWFSEGVLLAILPVLAYYFAYVYEVAFFQTFKGPRTLISVDMMTVLTFGSALAGFGYLLTQVVEGYLFEFDDTAVKKLTLRRLVVTHFLGCVVFWLLLATLTDFRWHPVWVVPGFLLGLFLSRDYWRRRHTAPWPGPKPLVFKAIILFGLGTSVAVALGYNSAIKGSYYRVVDPNTTLIILRKYGDLLICVKVDPQTRSPTGEFRVIPFGSDTAPLDVVEFGSLVFGP